MKKIHIALYYLLLQYLPVGKSYNRFSKIWWIIRGITCKKYLNIVVKMYIYNAKPILEVEKRLKLVITQAWV